MRKSSAAKSAASSPPVPARTSRIALLASASSFGRRTRLPSPSSSGTRAFRARNSCSASSRMSLSEASVRSGARSAISRCAPRSRSTASTTGVSSAYSFDSLAKSDAVPEASRSRSSACRRAIWSSFASRGAASLTSAERAEPIGKLGQRHFLLLALVEVAQYRGAARHLGLAQDHGDSGRRLVGPLQALLHVAAVAELDDEAGAAQLLGELQRWKRGILARRDDGDRPPLGLRLLDQHCQPLDAGGPADRGKRWAAHDLAQPVVAAAAHDGALRAELGGDELEGRVDVVVEAANEPRVHLVLDPERVEPASHAVEERARGGCQIVGVARRLGVDPFVAFVL